MSGSRFDWSTQISDNAAITSVFDCSAAMVRAVPPVTHPPQENPTTASAIAPQATPYKPGFSHSGVCMVVSSGQSKRTLVTVKRTYHQFKLELVFILFCQSALHVSSKHRHLLRGTVGSPEALGTMLEW